MTAIKICGNNHARLTKVAGQITAKTGKIATYDDAVGALLDKWEQEQTESKGTKEL